MKIVIRKAVSHDCQRIRPLQREIAKLHYDGKPEFFKEEPRYFSQTDFDERLNHPDHLILIAECNGEVVGYVFAWIQRIRNHPTYRDFDNFYIDDICVVKEKHRLGIGKMLFEQCKEKAKAWGCQSMELGVYAFNRDAIAFYKAMGMTERMHRMEYRMEKE